MDFQEYSHIKSESKGCMTPGKMKLSQEHMIFQNRRSGKSEQIKAAHIESASYQNFSGGTWGIRLVLLDGSLRRFVGFKDADKDKIRSFFKKTYRVNVAADELCVKGWNWGAPRFQGSTLSFHVAGRTAFDIPLSNVSKCCSGKNEVALEFHHSDDAAVSLVEMRFFVPPTDTDSAVDKFHRQVAEKANLMNAPGDAIATFNEVQSVTPRGRYDIKLFSSMLQLHGKTFDYKVPISTVVGLFLLPHKDGRQTFFMVSLNPPIKQGQTRYHFIVLLFGPDEVVSVTLSYGQQLLKSEFEKLYDEKPMDEKFYEEISGPTYQVFGKIIQTIVGKKITFPGSFVGHSGTPAIACSYKAAAGYLYPLSKCFVYVHKPPIHILLGDVSTVNFPRNGGSTRSFDFEVELTSGGVYTFNGIEKSEYSNLCAFVNSKKLKVKDKGPCHDIVKTEAFGESGIDAYLERVMEEQGAEGSSTDDGSSKDDDFKPDKLESDDASDDSVSDSDVPFGPASPKEVAKKNIKKKHEQSSGSAKKTTKTPKEKGIKPNAKAKKGGNQPRGTLSAFMIWLTATRNEIKANNPGLKATEIAKKAGEIWRKFEDKSEWEKKAAHAQKEYAAAKKKYAESSSNKSRNEKGKTQITRSKKIKNKHINKKFLQKTITPKKTGDNEPENLNNSVNSKNGEDTIDKKSGPYTSKEFISDIDSETSEEEK